MPLYALDQDDHIVAATDVGPFGRYRCLECRTPMQKRTGPRRQAHFYHIHTIRQCRLHSRSIDHLVIQTAIQQIIPTIVLEKPFKKTLRIADLCWEEKKIIFEIQCSPIDISQIKRRTHDYAEEGYELIWLLDDRLYNRKKTLRFAEAHMRRQGCYYFSFRQKIIYDQFEVIQVNKRLLKGPPLPIDLLQVKLAPLDTQHITQQLDHRSCRYFFGGDLLDRAIHYPIYLQRLQELEEHTLKSQRPQNAMMNVFKKYLYSGLEFLLKRFTSNVE